VPPKKKKKIYKLKKEKKNWWQNLTIPAEFALSLLHLLWVLYFVPSLLFPK
jgi:hypothetical protein